jgi:hypothetical protein
MPLRPHFLATALLLALVACKDREITAYRAPKDPAPTGPAQSAGTANTNDLPPNHPPIGTVAPADAGAMAATAVPTGTSNLSWTAPAAWETKPTSAMRRGSYAVKDGHGAVADLSITAFPGDTGGLQANLNRWRGQLGLSPLDGSGPAAGIEALEAGDLHFQVVDLAGTAAGTPTRILGAILPFQGETWFFKLTGPEVLVAQQKPAFLAFLRTVQAR